MISLLKNKFPYLISLIYFRGILLLFSFLLFGLQTVQSQDIHFSQYFNNPLNTNPAQTAYFAQNLRVTLSHRNQWASVTVPYQTFSASFDGKIINLKKRGLIIGLGLLLNKDEAGDSKYGTTQGAFNLSVIKALNRSNKNIISFGFQTAYSQRSIDYTKLQFPEQWNGSTALPLGSNTEQFEIEGFTFFDINMGALWYYAFNNNVNMTHGISLWHINKADQNLFENEFSTLNIKTTFHSDWEIKINHSGSILPSIMYTFQGKQQEMIVGARYLQSFRNSRIDKSGISYGLFWRNRDALIIYAGLDYKNWRLGTSYDVNFSTLSAASNYWGGFEVNLQMFLGKSKKPKTLNPTPCPVF